MASWLRRTIYRGADPNRASNRSNRPQNLTVFAAASLIDPFTAIGEQFQAGHPGVRVAYNFAGSQQLVQQLAQGAPADVFASADTKQMDAAVQSGSVLTGSPQVFAHNRLVVVFPKDNPGGRRVCKTWPNRASTWFWLTKPCR